ncbi:MAG: phosphonate ABC transporter, permease protein PhnE [Novosphingobium sp.]
MTVAVAFPRRFGWRHAVFSVLALALLATSAVRMDIGRLVRQVTDVVLAPVGLGGDAPGSQALGEMIARLVPIQVSDRQAISAIPGFDAANLPLFTRIETTRETVREIDPATLEPVAIDRSTTWLVHPFGYVLQVADEMLETVEIAVWGTLLAIALAMPLALAGARPLAAGKAVRGAARGLSALLRAVPELLSALFLVAAFGFGPAAGILALGLHAAGYLGRTIADAIEDADQRPIRAVQAMGAGALVSFRLAIWPQVRAPFVSAAFYILDRNVRAATVVGLVGAGGIGQELKGRMDMFEYGHVGTILIAIFLVVVLLDRIAMRLRQTSHIHS